MKVSFPGGGRSDTPYVVRFRAMASGLPVKSWRATSRGGGGAVRIVGEVLNNSGSTVGRPTVKATFRSCRRHRRGDAQRRRRSRAASATAA